MATHGSLQELLAAIHRFHGSLGGGGVPHPQPIPFAPHAGGVAGNLAGDPRFGGDLVGGGTPNPGAATGPGIHAFGGAPPGTAPGLPIDHGPGLTPRNPYPIQPHPIGGTPGGGGLGFGPAEPPSGLVPSPIPSQLAARQALLGYA